MDRDELIREAEVIRKNRLQTDAWPEWYEEYEKNVNVKKIRIPCPGLIDLDIYVVRPVHVLGVAPVCIDLHGGGFVFGMERRNMLLAASLSCRTGYVFIEAEYALAPEHPWPAAFEQCCTLLDYVRAHSIELGVDARKIVLAGHSAGANIAAAVTLHDLKTGNCTLLGQILDYPPLDFLTDPADRPEVEENPIPVERARAFNTMYVDDPEKRDNPYVSPVAADKTMLTGMPQTLLITAGMDALKSEADRYMVQLVDAGVTVLARRFDKSHHGMSEYCRDEWLEAHNLMSETLIRWAG